MIYEETLWAEIIEPMLPRIKEAEAELAKLYDISQIITASRSVILLDVQLQTRYLV